MIGSTGDDEKTGFWGSVLKMGKSGWDKSKQAMEKKGMEISTKTLQNVVKSEKGQKIGAAFIKEGITQTVDEVRNNARGLVRQGKDYLNPENKTAYQIIRNSLNPSEGKPADGFIKSTFKSLVARVLDVGTGIAGWIGATFVNKVINPADKVTSHDVHNIFASFMAKVFGGGKNIPVVA